MAIRAFDNAFFLDAVTSMLLPFDVALKNAWLVLYSAPVQILFCAKEFNDKIIPSMKK